MKPQTESSLTNRPGGIIEIDVHGGNHDGATGRLKAKPISILGSAPDCDLRLTDAGVAAHHLAVGLSGCRYFVRPVDGHCTVNGKRVAAGQSAQIANGDRIELQGTDVWLKTRNIDTEAASTSVEETETPVRRLPHRSKIYVAVLALAIAISIGGKQLLSHDATPLDAAAGVAEVLTTLEIDSEVEVFNEAGVISLLGVLPHKKSAALEVSLQSLPRTIVNRTQSISQLLEQVRNVFRTNGLHADLEYLGERTVQVGNLDGENPRIQQIAGRARDDVAILKALTFAPVSGADRSGKRLVIDSSDPNKRLTTIIDGDTAYVATTDGGRYFVGSVLPGGFMLRAISADGIQVDDNGEIYWLAL